MNATTVPGAISGYDAMLKRFGTLTFKETFERAARMADEGWGQAERRHFDLANTASLLVDDPDSRRTFLVGDRAPNLYAIIRNPSLARALRLIQQEGRDAFYRGDIAKAIVEKVQGNGGVMTPRDLAEFESEWVEPISTSYHGYDVFELPPPGQGFAALEMLNILEVCVPKLGFSLAALGPTNPMYWHLMVEAKKLAYADLLAHNADPKFSAVPVSRLISKQYAETLCSRINPDCRVEDRRAREHGWRNDLSDDGGSLGEHGVADSQRVQRVRQRGDGRPVRLRAPESRHGVFSRPAQPECRRAAQASVPHHHRRLRDEGWPAAHDLRQHGRDRAAGNPRAAHGEPDRPRHERADDDRRGALHAQPERQRRAARGRSLRPGRQRPARQRARRACGRRARPSVAIRASCSRAIRRFPSLSSIDAASRTIVRSTVSTALDPIIGRTVRLSAGNATARVQFCAVG